MLKALAGSFEAKPDCPSVYLSHLSHLIAQTITYLQAAQPEDGFYPCHRWHPWGYKRADDNVFYQALLAFTLQRVAPRLPAAQAQVLNEISQKITARYWQFQSVPGLASYAFWQTHPVRRFWPNGYYFHRDEFFRPPDDADDTAIIYLTSSQTQENKRWLREAKYPQHTNLNGRRIVTTIEEWKDKPAYTTFFGRDMPLGFDVSVMANVLYWVYREGFALTEHDEACQWIIEDTLRRSLWDTNPYLASPYYPFGSHILYNITRLLADHDNAFTQRLRLLAKTEVEKALVQKTHSPVQRLKLEIAWMKLGGVLPLTEAEIYTRQTWPEANHDFHFFVLGLPTEYDLKIAQWLAPRRWLHLRFTCPAYHHAVWLEWLVLKQSY